MANKEALSNKERDEKIIDIKNKVLRKITPTKEEEKKALNLFKKIKKTILQVARDKKVEIRNVELVGSVAKGTFLRGNKDLDIFLFFDSSLDREGMEKYGREIGEEVFKRFNSDYEIKYAEHPYVKGEIEGHKVEVVPAYYFEELDEIKSAVDRTPFHKRYVMDNLSEEMKGEVRLLKRFMKGIGVYGSELKTKGFSGYACELLVIKYGSFENVLRNAINWRLGERIVLDQAKGKGRGVGKGSVGEKGKGVVLVDPVDSNRNVLAALSLHNLSSFKFFAYYFLKHPAESYFYLLDLFLSDKGKEEREKIKRRERQAKEGLIVVIPNKYKIIEDIFFPQIDKFMRYVAHMLREEDIEVSRSIAYYDDSVYEGGIYFSLPINLSGLKKVKGPSLFATYERIEGFVNKYEYVYIEGSTLYAKAKRKYDLYSLIDMWKKMSLKERRERGVPTHIAEVMEEIKVIEISSKNSLNNKDLLIKLWGLKDMLSFALNVKVY